MPFHLNEWDADLFQICWRKQKQIHFFVFLWVANMQLVSLHVIIFVVCCDKKKVDLSVTEQVRLLAQCQCQTLLLQVLLDTTCECC